jgi:phage terminase large subunit-like protein
MLPILYEFPEAMQVDPARPWADPANWPMVLPNLGRSISSSGSRRISPRPGEGRGGGAALGVAASQRRDRHGLHSARWRGADLWEDAGDREVDARRLLARCEVVVAGADGGGLDDLFGLCVAGRERGTKRWLYWFHAWALARGAEAPQGDRGEAARLRAQGD